LQQEFGRYRLIRHLATGGMGEVYLAEAVGAAGFAKRVVIKTLRADLAADTELVGQFVAEGQLLEALDHPNIAQILDLGLAGDTYFLAMEFVEGFDLRALQRALPAPVRSDLPDGIPRLGEPAVLYLVAAVARALDHAAGRRGPDGKPLRIVHHDVTPSNVMVRSDGHVKLVDFGVARSAVMSRLSAGALRGKLPYLSPEHAAHGRVDGRADLFALGLCAYEWLSGQRALEVTEPDALPDAYARLGGKLALLAQSGQVSPNTLDLLRSLVELDPSARPHGPSEVADRAEALLLASGAVSPARALATELAPAFQVLAARAGSFDQTLAQMLTLDSAPDAHTGTLSLPGIEAVQVAAASAASVASGPELAAALPPPRRRGRKRWITAAFSVLAAAVAIGWWLGARRPEPNPPAVPDVLAPQPDPRAALPAATAPAAVQVLPQPKAPVALPAALAGSPGKPVVRPDSQPAGQAPGAKTAQEGPATPDSTGPPPDAKPAAEDDSAPRKDKVELAVVEFIVFPANCLVALDGEAVSPVTQGGNRYRLRVRPGDHRISVRDPSSPEAAASEVVADLRAGEHRILRGFKLGKELP